MFGHMPELLIILALALIVFGPDKLPEVASTVGKAVREVRSALETATHPEDHEVPEDFSTYYYESLARVGEDVPEEEEGGPDYYPLVEDDESEGDQLEPIPIRSDTPEAAADEVEEVAPVPPVEGKASPGQAVPDTPEPGE
jgi:TatA/E family protein of Tat protein translocase